LAGLALSSISPGRRAVQAQQAARLLVTVAMADDPMAQNVRVDPEFADGVGAGGVG
jgi:hypothetical protein